jgi:hypothetical protein
LVDDDWASVPKWKLRLLLDVRLLNRDGNEIALRWVRVAVAPDKPGFYFRNVAFQVDIPGSLPLETSD